MEKDIYKIVGSNIKKYREKKGYSYDEFSKMIGLDKDYLEEIEKKGVDGSITFDVLDGVCKCLDISMKELLEDK